MSSKNIFRTNGKNININTGKLQFNTSTETFRNKIQMFADGINKMNDERLKYVEKIKATQAYIVVLQGESVVSESDVNAALEKIEKYKEALHDITAEIMENMPEYDDTDKNLFYAYRQYINDEINYDTYERAFAEWLDNGNIVPTHQSITYISKRIGVKKASAKTMYKNGGTKFTANLGQNQYLELVYRIVCDMMYEANALKKFTYTYEPEKTKKTATTEQTTPENAQTETAPAETTPNA